MKKGNFPQRDEIAFYGREETLKRYRANPKAWTIPKTKFELIKEKEREKFEKKEMTSRARKEIEKENRPKLHKRVGSAVGRGLDKFAKRLF